MNFLECVKTRRSVRSFTDQKISLELIEEIVEIASFSPSWKNTQVPRYTFTQNKEIINEIAQNGVLGFELNSKVLKKADGLMIISYIENRSGFERDGSFSTEKGDRFEMFDAGIASQTLCLAAHEKGLGTVIMGYFDEQKIINLLDIPQGQKIATLIPMGYPEGDATMPKRKLVSDLLTIK